MSKGHEQPQNTPKADALCFANVALMLAGIAGRQLGWRADDFWRATPAELTMMLGLGQVLVPGSSVGNAPNHMGSDIIDRLMKEFPDG